MQQKNTPMMAGHPPTQRWKQQEKDGYLTTPLHVAAIEGEAASVKSLLARGSFVDAPDQDEHTPLHMAIACECGRVNIPLLSQSPVDGRWDTTKIIKLWSFSYDRALSVFVWF